MSLFKSKRSEDIVCTAGADIVPGSARDIVHAEGVDIVPYVAPLRHPAFIGKPSFGTEVPCPDTNSPAPPGAADSLHSKSYFQNSKWKAPQNSRSAGLVYPSSRRSCVAAETGRGPCRPPRPANGRISSAPQAQISSTPPGVDFVRPPAAGFRSLWCTAQISRVHWGKQKAHAPRKGENRLRLRGA